MDEERYSVRGDFHLIVSSPVSSRARLPQSVCVCVCVDVVNERVKGPSLSVIFGECVCVADQPC